MDLPDIGDGFSLTNLDHLNVLLGKNGCGKSHLLKHLRSRLQGREGFGTVRYVSPERGGFLRYEAGIDQNVANDPNWMTGERNRNQAQNFRQQSASLYRQLEYAVLREIEEDHGKPGYVRRSFDDTVEMLNTLLDRVELRRDKARGFKIFERHNDLENGAEALSSGESELISLGIEFLSFVKEAVPGVANVLLVDEPDVHLHPDLQDRLARFIVRVLEGQPVTLILATHSTALLAGLADGAETRVAFMRRGQHELAFKSVTEVDRAILPIFGAHPLSNVFNQAPVLLIEGEDDERVWQQAVRSSQGRLRVYPCVVDGLPHFAEFEREVSSVIDAVYDNARAFSLRDRDQQPEEIGDLGNVRRMRLSCRAAENLMLSDDVLARAGTTWPNLQQQIRGWADASVGHQYHAQVVQFIEGGFDRKGHDLKRIRNILIGLFSEKPWEVLVGQSIAELTRAASAPVEGGLRDYLGEAVCEGVLGLG